MVSGTLDMAPSRHVTQTTTANGINISQTRGHRPAVASSLGLVVGITGVETLPELIHLQLE